VRGRRKRCRKQRAQAFSNFHSSAPFGYSYPMFDIVRPQIATAADKLTHLRRFL
jgi:hypothetical protein